MAATVTKYKDELVQNTMDQYPSAAFGWYLQAAYAYHALGRPIISDPVFDALEKRVQFDWNKINSPYKKYVTYTSVKAGSSFIDFTNIPPLIRKTAENAVREVYGLRSVIPPVVSTTPIPEVRKPLTGDKPVRVGIAGKIYVYESLSSMPKDAALKEQAHLNVRNIANKYKCEYYNTFVIHLHGKTRADVSARMLGIMTDLQEADIPVRSYILSEILIDSAVKDVWDVIKK